MNQIQQPDASRTAQRELHAARVAQLAEGVMAKDPKMNGPSDGGQVCASDADASATLALGHPKSGTVKTAWGQKDQSSAGSKLTGR